MHRRLHRAIRNGGLLIVAHALAVYAGHLCGRALSAANHFVHRPHHFSLFGG